MVTEEAESLPNSCSSVFDSSAGERYAGAGASIQLFLIRLSTSKCVDGNMVLKE